MKLEGLIIRVEIQEQIIKGATWVNRDITDVVFMIESDEFHGVFSEVEDVTLT